MEVILLALKEAFTKNKGTFTFTEDSTAKSQLSAKILTSGFLENTLLFVGHVKDEEGMWKFDDLYKNEEKLNAFKCWYKQWLSKKYGIDEKSILITKLVKGCIKVKWATIRKSDENKVA